MLLNFELAKIEDKRKKGMAENEIIRYINDPMDMNLSKIWEMM